MILQCCLCDNKDIRALQFSNQNIIQTFCNRKYLISFLHNNCMEYKIHVFSTLFSTTLCIYIYIIIAYGAYDNICNIRSTRPNGVD